MARTVFWGSVGLLFYTHFGYPALLWLLVRTRRRAVGGEARSPHGERADPAALPVVSLVIAAHDEGEVIADRVANARALDYPADRLEVIVASDGSCDRTVDLARAAGADRVLDLPRGGKVNAQDAAVEIARGEVLAFSDANSRWAPDALRRLVSSFADPTVGYACGQVRLVRPGGSSQEGRDHGSNEEGVYWRYENGVRSLESRLAGITAGNGAIYAVRRCAYLRPDARTSHDLSFPFNMVKRGLRAVYVPEARAEEEMAPTVEGEFRRKRRMMRHAWPTVLGGGLLSPRGYPALYLLEVLSHRGLRYASPVLHIAALASNLVLVVTAAGATVRPPERRSTRRGDRRRFTGRRAAAGAPVTRRGMPTRRDSRTRRGASTGLYATTLATQIGLLALAAAAPELPRSAPASAGRLAALARYYVLVTAAVGAGLWDHLREGTPTWWERAPGTR